MKQTINVYDFETAFQTAHRQDNFTYAGLHALFEYLEQYEEDCDTEIELDVIALCCEYTEYNTIEDFWVEYDADEYPDFEAIANNTSFISIDDDSFIIQQF
jgi:hypothetical protein